MSGVRERGLQCRRMFWSGLLSLPGVSGLFSVSLIYLYGLHLAVQIMNVSFLYVYNSIISGLVRAMGIFPEFATSLNESVQHCLRTVHVLLIISFIILSPPDIFFVLICRDLSSTSFSCISLFPFTRPSFSYLAPNLYSLIKKALDFSVTFIPISDVSLIRDTGNLKLFFIVFFIFPDVICILRYVVY